MRGSRFAVAIGLGFLVGSGCAVGVVGDVGDPEPTDAAVLPTVTVPATGTARVEGGVDANSPADASVPQDSASPPPDAATPPLDAGGCTGTLVINEVQTEGTSADQEFVEIYNPSTCDVVLEGWALKYSSANGSTPSTFFTGLISHRVLSKGYFVVACSTFGGPKNATYSGGTLAGDDGQVGLFDKLGRQVDAVGYGTIAMKKLTEGNPAPTPGAVGKSVQRIPNGVDTDSNQVDFRSANSTPNAAN